MSIMSRSRVRVVMLFGVAGAALALGLASPAVAQTVALTGSMGDRALLVIDGKQVVVPAGGSSQGVRVVSVQGSQAVVEVGGKRQTLVIGAAQVNLGGGAAPGSGTTIVLTAGTGGHFQTQGSINGHPVSFLVDTGATAVSMSTADAKRVGIDYEKGMPVGIQTANGTMRGWRVTLDRVRVGDVEIYGVDGTVAERDMPYVLLGNSFLNRFQMKRENDRMTLERRY